MSCLTECDRSLLSELVPSISTCWGRGMGVRRRHEHHGYFEISEKKTTNNFSTRYFSSGSIKKTTSWTLSMFFEKSEKITLPKKSDFFPQVVRKKRHKCSINMYFTFAKNMSFTRFFSLISFVFKSNHKFSECLRGRESRGDAGADRRKWLTNSPENNGGHHDINHHFRLTAQKLTTDSCSNAKQHQVVVILYSTCSDTRAMDTKSTRSI